MNYSNNNQDFLDFLVNPKKNNKVLKNNIYYKLMYFFYKLSLFKNWLSYRYSKYFFKEELRLILLKKNNFENNPNFNISKNTNKFINHFEKIFTFYYLNNKKNPSIDYHIRGEKNIKSEYLVNRIKELDEFKENNELDIIKNSDLVTLFFCSELLYFLEVDLLKVILIEDIFYLTINEKEINKVKAYWLSEILEFNTNKIDKEKFKSISILLKKRKKIQENKIINLSNYIFDKVFQIQPQYLKKELVKSEKFIFLKNIIIFSSIIECFYINNYNRIKINEIRKLGLIDEKFLDFIKIFLNYDLFQNKEYYFIYIKGNYIYRGSLTFKLGLRTIAKHLIDKKMKKMKELGFKGTDFFGELGDAFDQDYIYNYLKKEEYKDLLIVGEFKPGNKSKIKGYDIDLIIYDKKQNLYYFIQIKFKFNALPIYLNERIIFFNDLNIKKGISQLKSLKNNLEDETIKEKLKNYKDKKNNIRIDLSNAQNHNTHFVLLHNIPYLNFYEDEGIYFYEWNLLRRILDGCRIDTYKNKKLVDIEKVNNLVRLDKPYELVNNYINGKEELQEAYELYKNIHCGFKLGNKKVKTKLL